MLRKSADEHICPLDKAPSRDMIEEGAAQQKALCLRALWAAEERLIRAVQDILPQLVTPTSNHQELSIGLLEQIRSCFAECRENFEDLGG